MGKTLVFQIFNFMLWVALVTLFAVLLPDADKIAVVVAAAVAALVVTTIIQYLEYRLWEANHRKKWERIARDSWGRG